MFCPDDTPEVNVREIAAQGATGDSPSQAEAGAAAEGAVAKRVPVAELRRTEHAVGADEGVWDGAEP